MLKQFFLVLTVVDLLNALNRLSCEPYDGICTHQSDNNLLKTENAIFMKCNDTQICFESGSKFSLKDTSGLYVETQAFFNLLQNSSFAVTGDGVVKSALRSYLMNRGNVTVNSAKIHLTTMSQLWNHGEIHLQPQSMILIDAMSFIRVHEYGQLQLEEESAMRIYTQSRMEFFKHSKRNKQGFIMKPKSTIFLDDAAEFVLTSGQVVLYNQSQLSMYGKSSCLIDGFVEIRDSGRIGISKFGELVVGYYKLDADDTKRGHANSTFIVRNSMQLLVGSKQSLLVEYGAHCLLKKNLSLEENVKLDSSTQNEIFACFANRDDLIAAVDNI